MVERAQAKYHVQIKHQKKKKCMGKDGSNWLNAG